MGLNRSSEVGKRPEVVDLVAKKGEPALANIGAPGRPSQPARDGALEDWEAELEQFAVDPRSSPSRILRRHAKDERPKFSAHGFSPPTCLARETHFQ